MNTCTFFYDDCLDFGTCINCKFFPWCAAQPAVNERAVVLNTALKIVKGFDIEVVTKEGEEK